jgi:transposase
LSLAEVPAENNRAERELRPLVIARKVSFGSQSDAGAKTRASIMTLLNTVKKRLKDQSLEEWLKGALDKIVENPQINFATLIPPPLVNPPYQAGTYF